MYARMHVLYMYIHVRVLYVMHNSLHTAHGCYCCDHICINVTFYLREVHHYITGFLIGVSLPKL